MIWFPEVSMFQFQYDDEMRCSCSCSELVTCVRDPGKLLQNTWGCNSSEKWIHTHWSYTTSYWYDLLHPITLATPMSKPNCTPTYVPNWSELDIWMVLMPASPLQEERWHDDGWIAYSTMLRETVVSCLGGPKNRLSPKLQDLSSWTIGLGAQLKAILKPTTLGWLKIKVA